MVEVLLYVHRNRKCIRDGVGGGGGGEAQDGHLDFHTAPELHVQIGLHKLSYLSRKGQYFSTSLLYLSWNIITAPQDFWTCRGTLLLLHKPFILVMETTVLLPKFMYLVFIRMSRENYRRRLGLLCLCDVFRSLIYSLDLCVASK